MCMKAVDTNQFASQINYCNECDLQSKGFTRASMKGLIDVQRKLNKDEKIQQAIKEAYDNSEAKLEADRKEAKRIYDLEHPPILNEKYTDIRNKIPKYSEIED